MFRFRLPQFWSLAIHYPLSRNCTHNWDFATHNFCSQFCGLSFNSGKNSVTRGTWQPQKEGLNAVCFYGCRQAFTSRSATEIDWWSEMIRKIESSEGHLISYPMSSNLTFETLNVCTITWRWVVVTTADYSKLSGKVWLWSRWACDHIYSEKVIRRWGKIQSDGFRLNRIHHQNLGFTSHSKCRKCRVWYGSSSSHAKIRTKIKIETGVSGRSTFLRQFMSGWVDQNFHCRPAWSGLFQMTLWNFNGMNHNRLDGFSLHSGR
jgi:hypothetical protein